MEVISIFRRIGLMSANKEQLLHIVMSRYREIDPYKWQTHFNLICNDEDVSQEQINEIKFDYVPPAALVPTQVLYR